MVWGNQLSHDSHMNTNGSIWKNLDNKAWSYLPVAAQLVHS